ncbi:hypothetical protein [Burkholderia glumae]|uniref:Uncharacterized protein n=1 Tax=Burkholderia glumae TaxID=337 RepID=A0AAP9XZM5_BURGL|nr:hypothetical protein [Burkholderia glumae]ACR32574.1 Hypothetical protein bglu_2g22740 [Burkholderia glumae BGR1]AJY64288.1 hypothetical protein KS03_3644 [Burkholderia glumae LMG 2196 = ATCC 33617]KHJ62375.1 hypothetical protein NCPPB3923_13860 [Burkholderia glumae]MCM2484219.1 hypothetical protein [Burkholderia glumae]MCM2494614.1 hypothetical protein [Burkholderia glumae]
MNSDYLFYRRPATPGPYSLDDLGEVAPSIAPGHEIRDAIDRVISDLAWRESEDVPGAWFGEGVASFHLTVESDGHVTSFMGSRLERRQVLQLARALGLIALDLQRDVVFA